MILWSEDLFGYDLYPSSVATTTRVYYKSETLRDL